MSAQGALSQGFKTDTNDLPAGSLVILKNDGQNSVEPATSDKAMRLVGVTAEKPLVALGDGTQQAQVVVSGQTSTLVSDINGTVRIGDKITASPISGVGMKAVDSAEIVGTAESKLSSDTTRTITDKTGKKQQVHISTISVQVNVSYYAVQQDKLSALVPTFLLNFGSAIAGKNVSPMRVFIGFFCLLVGFIMAGVILQAAVRSGIISIGRNPLAHTVLRQSLIDVLVTCVGLLLITVITFYVTLTI